MTVAFDIESTESTPFIENTLSHDGVGSERGLFILMSGSGTCKLEYSLDGAVVIAEDGTSLVGPGSYGPFVLPESVTHIRLTNVSGNSVGVITR